MIEWMKLGMSFIFVLAFIVILTFIYLMINFALDFITAKFGDYVGIFIAIFATGVLIGTLTFLVYSRT